MAQTMEVTGRALSASNVGVTVAQSGNTTLLEVPVEQLSALGVSISVTGQDLDAFVIHASAFCSVGVTPLRHPQTETSLLLALGSSGLMDRVICPKCRSPRR